ncbi:HlyD family type I secretion periplasmic adaptor subunit [Gallibacterium melopsittaci]|uniref:Membrane fusion protein (MFP) family protein n=3 Tax=Gallibacterium TaxID=155493 RepID=A0A1A7Q1V1_9PAST|nr:MULTISPECIES: HlyD family type I secretion periplasmic adaptor subunit [Gallibacterium]OBW94250.1 hemolysin D [Gallibacterium anatis]OBW98242.1 hemolysin D [Gallibacterium anatis]OBX07385.1 hemolysin D [Gallibacterium genomosp. 3]
MNVKCQAFKDFLVRYCQQFRAVWKIRRQLDNVERTEDEYQFLPAHLELIEKPVSALPRWIARLIMLLTIIAVIWAILGKVEIVASATGKLTYTGKSKVIQSVETAIVKGIFVKDGQKVTQGQKLLALTTLGVEADFEKTKKALKDARLAVARNEALLEAMVTKKSPTLVLPNGLNKTDVDVVNAQNLIVEQFNTYIKQREQAESLLKQREAERETALYQVEKYQGLEKIEAIRLNDLKNLYEKAALSKHSFFEQETKVIEIRNELRSQQNKLVEIEASIKQARDAYDLLLFSFRRDTQDALRQAREQVEQLVFEEQKLAQRQSTTSITAPVTGTVQQLNVHTIGGVVTDAQNLMVIVPEEDKLEVTASISNSDIGFIEVGQPVTIKIEAFPYSRYGYITGTVRSVSFDAIEDKDLGLVFSSIISINQDYLIIEGKKIPLSAGMRVTAEIKTGKRRVISYLLSPLQETLSESMRER